MIARLAAAFAVVAALLSPAAAATFSAKRGLNLDIWVTWPAEKEWAGEAVLFPYPEWRKFLSAEDLAQLKADGFDFLRMPVDPAPFLSDVAPALRERLLAEVVESARMVNAAGLKVIVDLHLIPAGPRSIGMERVMDEPALFDRYVDLVRDMGEALAREDPELVAFELMNEPIVDCDGSSLWPERQKRLFAAARAAATRLTLVLTGACYSSAEKLALIDPAEYPDDNLMWDFHSYAPFLLTQQGMFSAGDFIPYVTGLPYPPHAAPRAEIDAALAAIRDRISAEAPVLRRAGMLAYLDELFAEIDTEEELAAVLEAPLDTVAAWAARHGIASDAILLGEFGMVRREYGTEQVIPAQHRAAYIRDMVAKAEARGFAWSIWGYGGAFGVVESFEGRKAEPDVLDVIRSLPPR